MSRHKQEVHKITAHQMPFQPMVLKELALEVDIPQGKLAQAVGVSRPTINLCVNRGYVPPTVENYREKVEAFLTGMPQVMKWLLERGMRIEGVWEPLGKDRRMDLPAGAGKRLSETRKAGRKPAMVTGLPDQIVMKWEVEMISEDAKRHFKLFRNPFIGDVEKSTDIFRSDEHRYIEAAMLDAAKHGGFLAVIGEVGSGKSTIRREVMEQLKRDSNVQVVFPQIIDKARITAESICDAIVHDLSEEKPRVRLEAKARQTKKILEDRSKAGYQACLVIEEAHDLSTAALKYLKRFYELEDGYKKLLGIILIGQTELRNMFNESQHVEMREVIRRVQVAEIRGLDGNIREYLALKFKRVGGDLTKIMNDEAIEALSRRLTVNDNRQRPVSHAYPLLVNNYVARAMNLAAEMGEPQITAEVVNSI